MKNPEVATDPCKGCDGVRSERRSRREGEEERLGVDDLLLPSHQELLHTTQTRCKLVPKEEPEDSQELVHTDSEREDVEA
ncbi:hypothetical protein Taro_038347 [Colocasia esculenta]|uniref:Uncharacterized protein n=1 Tax=Colocasia esculenta TaxID=4460 RepID=A0A843WLZ1_COLES|nr:hypothetical protein [Colocasia esculenta]